jgi:hypothetical protein
MPNFTKTNEVRKTILMWLEELAIEMQQMDCILVRHVRCRLASECPGRVLPEKQVVERDSIRTRDLRSLQLRRHHSTGAAFAPATPSRMYSSQSLV